MYIPPFTITDEITSLIADVAEKVTAIAKSDSEANSTAFITFIFRIKKERYDRRTEYTTYSVRLRAD